MLYEKRCLIPGHIVLLQIFERRCVIPRLMIFHSSDINPLVTFYTASQVNIMEKDVYIKEPV